MDKEITIVGFPKCGTTALMRHFEQSPDCHVIRTSKGGYEVRWPLIRELRTTPPADRILVHKFTGYIFNPAALEYLSAVNYKSIIVLCVRDPARVIVSWHNMHRSFALDGRPRNHFVLKEKDFYANCSIAEYYEHFARKRLQYDNFLHDILAIVPKERMAVVSQEKIAQDLGLVANYIKSLAKCENFDKSVTSIKEVRHQGFADKAKVELDGEIANELQGVRERLSQLIASEVVHKCV